MKEWKNYAAVGAGVLVGLYVWRAFLAGLIPAAALGSKSGL